MSFKAMMHYVTESPALVKDDENWPLCDLDRSAKGKREREKGEGETGRWNH